MVQVVAGSDRSKAPEETEVPSQTAIPSQSAGKERIGAAVEPVAATSEPEQAAPAAGRSPSGLPAHARSRPLHWLATAVGIAAVIGSALVIGPAGAAQTGSDAAAHALPSASAGAPAPVAPDPAKAVLPLDCGGAQVHLDQQFAAVLPAPDATPVTVVAARCEAGGGTPPDGLFVLRGSAVLPLLDPAKGLTVQRVAMRADGAIHATVVGYSSPDVPNCCPDLHETLDWSYTGAGAWGPAVVTGNQAST